MHEANIPVNDYYLGFTRIHGTARTGKTLEQAVQINEYTAALPSHIQKAAYNAGTQAGAIADDASMQNATSVKVKTEQLRFNKWLNEHNTDVIAQKQEIVERFKEAEANGDVDEMNKQLKEYKALEQWSKETIRDRKAQIGKAVGGVVEYGGEKVDVQADKTGLSANATDIGVNATDIGANAVEYGEEEGDNGSGYWLDELDTDILTKDKRSMTFDDYKELRKVAKTLAATPENAVKIGSEKTWKEYLKDNPSTDLKKSARDYINLIIETNPWPEGYKPKTRTLSVGSTIYMAMSPGQPDTSPGGWATLDKLNSVKDVRSRLAITTEFKSNIDRMNIYEIVKELPVKEGSVGSQIDLIADTYLPGRGTQEKLDVPPMFRQKYLKKIGEIKLY